MQVADRAAREPTKLQVNEPSSLRNGDLLGVEAVQRKASDRIPRVFALRMLLHRDSLRGVIGVRYTLTHDLGRMVYAVKPMPRPKSLALDDVAGAALALIDRHGLASLSMRSVAEALGMGTMSLYRYVADREDLERLVVDRVLSGVDTELPARLGWRARLTLLVERARSAVSAHPALISLLLLHRSRSRHSTRWGEAVLRVLAEAGFSAPRRVIAFRTVLAYLIRALQLIELSALTGAGTRALAELPEAEYPLLAETARHALRVDAETEFRQGLALVIRGLGE